MRGHQLHSRGNRAGGTTEVIVYIGIGTVVLILVIILIIWALRGRTV